MTLEDKFAALLDALDIRVIIDPTNGSEVYQLDGLYYEELEHAIKYALNSRIADVWDEREAE